MERVYNQKVPNGSLPKSGPNKFLLYNNLLKPLNREPNRTYNSEFTDSENINGFNAKKIKKIDFDQDEHFIRKNDIKSSIPINNFRQVINPVEKSRKNKNNEHLLSSNSESGFDDSISFNDFKEVNNVENDAAPTLDSNINTNLKFNKRKRYKTRKSRKPSESKESSDSFLGKTSRSEGIEPNLEKYENFFDSDSDSDTMACKDNQDNSTNNLILRLDSKSTQKLNSGYFRYINQLLYINTGTDSFKMFQKSPEMYYTYHQGYRNQVSKWPLNPLDIFIDKLALLPTDKVIADFGCGDARLASSVKQKRVYSFDLVASNERVTICDIAHVPLKSLSLDIAIFCLSLMGTNIVDYVKEANRVLAFNGLLWIAEVKSRFKNVMYENFKYFLDNLGFHVEKVNDENKMFVIFECKKVRTPKKVIPKFELEPCLYKKR